MEHGHNIQDFWMLFHLYFFSIGSYMYWKKWAINIETQVKAERLQHCWQALTCPIPSRPLCAITAGGRTAQRVGKKGRKHHGGGCVAGINFMLFKISLQQLPMTPAADQPLKGTMTWRMTSWHNCTLVPALTLSFHMGTSRLPLFCCHQLDSSHNWTHQWTQAVNEPKPHFANILLGQALPWKQRPAWLFL